MKLHKEGECAKALRRAVELGLKHSDSAIVLNLVGCFHHYGMRIAQEDVGAEAAREHRRSALSAFSAAASLSPDCIDTAVSHAMMLAESERYVDAHAEYCRALRIPNPVDPAENDGAFDLCGDKSLTKDERIGKARERASRAMARFGAMICKEVVPMESVQVLDRMKLGGNAAAEAYERAKLLATTFPYSGRAQLLRAYVDLERVRGFHPSIDRRRFLRRTLGMIQEAADTFQRSLVIALFRAKLLFVLDEYDEAEIECRRALAVETPDDPSGHDLPPGFVGGAEYDDRVTFVKNQLCHLISKIVFAASVYSRLLTSKGEDKLISSRVESLLQLCELCNANGKSQAKTITDAVRFFKGNNSWSFLICPLSGRCDGRKFVGTKVLWSHLCSMHPEELWLNLESVLDPKQSEYTSERDCSLKWITLSQDSKHRNFFRLVNMNDMFEHLIRRLATSETGPESLVEMRTVKCREGAEILEDIKERLRTLPADISSSQFDKARSGIQNLWIKLLKVCVLDYREVVFPLVATFVWGKLKMVMSRDPDIVGHIGTSKIDPIFDEVPGAPVRNVSSEHGSNPSDANKMGTNRQNLKLAVTHQNSLLPSSSNERLKAAEEPQESEICVENGSSGAILNQKLYIPPENAEENEMEVTETMSNMSPKQELEGSNCPETSSPSTGTSGQLAEELTSTTSYLRVDFLNKNNTDKNLFILHVIVQSLWNLRCFRDELLRAPALWILHTSENRCVAELFYEIFSAWEKNEHGRVAVLLTSLKESLCEIANDNMFQKAEPGELISAAGWKNFAPEVVATVLRGLHMSETTLHFPFNNEIDGQVVSPISCGDCICRTHDLFGITFHVQMSCRCGKCFDEKEHTIILYRLDAGSPQTSKIKSFAELPVLYDEQPYSQGNCEHCGSPKGVDVFPSKTPHFFIIGLDWFGGCENHVQLSEVLVGIAQPVDIKLLCKDVHPSANYSLASMICYADGRYVCFARDQDKWLICNTETVEVDMLTLYTQAEDSWEQLLQRFTHRRLQPEVLFFELIK